ncbi:MAG: hypothetical protein Q7S94_10100 [Gallionella sp.]|nr:hypothetical protein [Gallionella sp.]
MNAHVRDSLGVSFEHLIPMVDLPDQNDLHVVAAAIHGVAPHCKPHITKSVNFAQRVAKRRAA